MSISFIGGGIGLIIAGALQMNNGLFAAGAALLVMGLLYLR